MKRKWYEKLKSRKWWIGFGGAVGGFVALFTTSGIAAKVSGAIIAAGSIVGYVIAEGLVDAAHKDVDKENKKD